MSVGMINHQILKKNYYWQHDPWPDRLIEL